MFNLGLGEIIVIAAIALVIMGPEKFPEFVKIAMRAYRDLRGYIDDIKREMAEELHPITRELQQLSRYNPEDYVENLAKAVTSIGEEDHASAPEEKPSDTPAEESAPSPAESAQAQPTAPAKEHGKNQDTQPSVPEQLDG
jgi:Tat protein translocase TatB subunit